MVRKEKKCKVILDWKIGSTKVMGLGWVEKYVVPRATAAQTNFCIVTFYL